MLNTFFTRFFYGGVIYCLGKVGVLQKLINNTIQPQNHSQVRQLNRNEDQNKQNKCLSQNQLSQVSDIKDINSVVSFSNEAVTSIIRHIQINPICKIVYSTYHKCPLSVHQFLNLNTIKGEAERASSFHQDQQISPKKFAVSNSYYISTGAFRNFQLTRGHMAAASNYSSSQQLKSSTFSFANTIPQNGSNNGGIWNTFQRYSRDLLKQNKCQTLQIISGPIFSSHIKKQGYQNVYINEQLVLMKNGIVVPPRLYKIIKCNTKDKAYASGFTFLNERTYDNSKKLIEFQDQIQSIEEQTGLVFNIKEKVTGKLTQYDNEPLNQTKQMHDRKFYSQLFRLARTTDDMNNALRRAYQQKISMNEQKQQNLTKIFDEGNRQFLQIKKQESHTSCQKLSKMLKLHKNLFYLGGDYDSIKSIQSQIENQIQNEISRCKQTISDTQTNSICYQMRQTGKYKCPHSSLINLLICTRSPSTVNKLKEQQVKIVQKSQKIQNITQQLNQQNKNE